MEWIEELHGRVVGLDTSPLIYFIEENPDYLGIVRPFFEKLSQGEFRAVTSIVTLTEVLVHPFRRNNTDLARRYQEILLNAGGLETIPLSREIASEAARLRAVHNLRTPDAIQLSTALNGGAEFFLTNDSRLPSLPALRVLVLDEVSRRT